MADSAVIHSSYEMLKWEQFRNVQSSLLEQVAHFHVSDDSVPDWNFGIFVTTEDEVYTIGYNYDGQLGIGSDVNRVDIPHKVSELCHKRVIGFSSGGRFVMALTEDGQVYSFGRATNGESGTGTSEDCLRSPVKIESLSGEHIVQISCGVGHTVALTKEGKVFSWGHNISYQTGRESPELVETPQEVMFPPGVNITSVSAGGLHSAAISSTGQVYTWGYNKFGQLGQGHTDEQVWSPSLVKNMNEETIIQVSAKYYVTTFLTASGCVYRAGWTNDSQDLTTPKLVSGLPRVMRIKSHWRYRYTIFEFSNGAFKEEDDDNNNGRWITRWNIEPAVRDKPVTCVKVTWNETQLPISDVILDINGMRMNAHGFILKSKCPHFIQVINSHGVLQESGTRFVTISGYSPEAYFMFVKYLYTNSLDSATALDHLDLVAIAREYSRTEVVTFARNMLMEQLSVDNSAIIYQKAQQLNLPDIQEDIVVKMSEMIDEIITSPGYATTDPEISKSIAIRMMSYRKNKDKSEKPTDKTLI